MGSIIDYANHGRIYEGCLDQIRKRYPRPFATWSHITMKEYYGYIAAYCMENSIEYEEIKLDVHAKAWLELAVKYESRAINHKPSLMDIELTNTQTNNYGI